MLFRLPLCMPLHANDELCVIVIAQTFDYAVGRRRLNNQSLAKRSTPCPSTS